MYRTMMAIIGMMILTGCSELQVIGRATVRELSADSVVSVESEQYKPRPVKVRTAETRTIIAQANIPERTFAKSERKELWRSF